MATKTEKTRDEINDQAAEAGVEHPDELPNKEGVEEAIADEADGDTFTREVAAHLADPQHAPAPAGAVINFGDPQPIRRG